MLEDHALVPQPEENLNDETDKEQANEKDEPVSDSEHISSRQTVLLMLVSILVITLIVFAYDFSDHGKNIIQ